MVSSILFLLLYIVEISFGNMEFMRMTKHDWWIIIPEWFLACLLFIHFDNKKELYPWVRTGKSVAFVKISVCCQYVARNTTPLNTIVGFSSLMSDPDYFFQSNWSKCLAEKFGLNRRLGEAQLFTSPFRYSLFKLKNLLFTGVSLNKMDWNFIKNGGLIQIATMTAIFYNLKFCV